MWVTGLLLLTVLGTASYVLWAWYQAEIQSEVWLIIGILILLWSATGGWISVAEARTSRALNAGATYSGSQHRTAAYSSSRNTGLRMAQPS
jgi:hypothetical protein